MKMLRVQRPAVATIMLLALLALAVSVAGRAPDPRKEIRLTANQAIDAIRPFLAPGISLNVTGPFEGQHHRYFVVDRQDVVGNVDAFDGAVRTLTLLDALPTSTTVDLPASAAKQIASDFLVAHGIRTTGVIPSVSLIDHGVMTEYVVEWQSRVDGALVPDYKSVSVNPATGAVFGLSDFSRPYEVPEPPSVSREAAEAAAMVLVAADGIWRQETIDLRMIFDDVGTQHLVWVIELYDGNRGAAVMVQVDAYTGFAKEVARG